MTAEAIKCKVKDGKCIDYSQGSQGKCRTCQFSTLTRRLIPELTVWECEYLATLCREDGYDINQAAAELIRQGIRSLRRHV